MDSIRFEPSVSATFAIDRNPSGGGGDLFADMLGDHLKKRAEADRPDAISRRKPRADRPQEEDRPAARRAGVVIKHAHDLRDVAMAARDVTPQKNDQVRLAAPTDNSGDSSDAGMDDQAASEELTVETAPDKDQQTDQQEPVLVTTPIAPVAPVEAANEVSAIVPAAEIPVLAEGQLAPAVETPEAAIVAPAEPAPVDPAAGSASAPATEEPQDAAAQANFSASLAASLGDTMAGLISSDAAVQATAGAEALASVNMTTLAAPKAATPAAPQAAAIELAANITPEAPRPVAEIKARSAARTTSATEIKAQATATQALANQAVQQPIAAQTPAQAAPVAAFGDGSFDSFDGAFSGDGTAAPGWALHLAQGAAAKRPDFIAQLRQHLQELPAHEQVAVNIQRALREGTNRVSIQLSPAELGKIHVKLEIDEEKRVTASVTVERPSTLELLQRDMKGLERALQDAGLKMDGSDLSFNLGRQDGEEFSQEMRQSGTPGLGNGSGETQAEGDAPAGQVAAQVDTAAGLVNVQI